MSTYDQKYNGGGCKLDASPLHKQWNSCLLCRDLLRGTAGELLRLKLVLKIKVYISQVEDK